MTKLRAPLHSFQAHGTLGNTLTYRSRKHLKTAGQVTTHPDARTLAQLYQRWLYHDAIEYWTVLTPAQKIVYQVAARAARLPVIAYFLQQYLLNPPDLMLWLPFDYSPQSYALDLSRKNHNGIYHGLLQTEGIIEGARHTDGIDDFTLVPHHADLMPTLALTIMCWLHTPGKQTGNWPPFLYKRVGSTGYFLRANYDLNIFEGRVFTTGAEANPSTAPRLIQDVHIALTYDSAITPNNCKLLINGQVVTQVTTSGPINTNTEPIYLQGIPGQFYEGMQDDARVYNRALTQSHIQWIIDNCRYPEPS